MEHIILKTIVQKKINPISDAHNSYALTSWFVTA